MAQIVPTPCQKVYVCFLPTNIKQQEVRKMFQPFGSILLFKFNQRKDGFTFAHITYQTIQQASQAIKMMNRKKMEDKVIKVSYAVANCQPKWKKTQKLKKSLSKTLYVPEQFLQAYTKKNKKDIKKEKKKNKQRELSKEVQKDLTKIIDSQRKEIQKPQIKKQKEGQQKISISNLNLFKEWLKKSDPQTEQSGAYEEAVEQYSFQMKR